MNKNKTVHEKNIERIVKNMKNDFDDHNKYHRKKICLSHLLIEIKKQFKDE